MSGFEHGRDLTSDFFDVGKVDAAIRLRWGGNGDENHIRVVHAFLGACGEMKAASGDIAVDQFLESGFVNGNFALDELLDFFSVVVDANDVMADLGKASARDETDIS